jgi:two-component system cell cycle sensor histidine kinase PleC
MLGLGTASEERRYLRARMELVVETLPATIFLNPLWTIALFLPFLRASGLFGHVPLSHLFVCAGLHLALSGFAAAIWFGSRNGADDLDVLCNRLVALQFGLSVAWGAVLWSFSDGSTVNTIYVCVIFVTVVWGIVFTRVSHPVVFLAGFAPVVAIYAARLLTMPGEVATVFGEMLPIWCVYIWFMGVRGRGRIDRTLAHRFENEDLSIALRAANAEAELKRQEAETANAAKTAFLANMSHELRTPLNAILGFSDIIAQQTIGSAARHAEYAADIHASGQHLLSLINDLLDVAKIEAGKMEIEPHPLDAAHVVVDLQRLLGPRAAARGQSLSAEMAPGLPLVMADERAFRQIVLNLLSNAVKFTPQGGTIVVAARPDSDGLLLQVEDDGPGIAKEKLAQIFTPFSQIDNRYGRQAGGTGLGLALVKGLVELHGGRVWIDSILGHGTVVNVYFPLAIAVPAPRAVANG